MSNQYSTFITLISQTNKSHITSIDTIYKKLRLIKKEYNDKRFYKSKNKFLNHTELKDTYLTLAQGDMGL